MTMYMELQFFCVWCVCVRTCVCVRVCYGTENDLLYVTFSQHLSVFITPTDGGEHNLTQRRHLLGMGRFVTPLYEYDLSLLTLDIHNIHIIMNRILAIEVDGSQ